MGAKPIHRIVHKLNGLSRSELEFVGAGLSDDGMRLGQDFRCVD